MTRGRSARIATLVVGASIGAGALTAAASISPDLGAMSSGGAPPGGQVVPAPELDVIPSSRDTEVAVVAGGCFWGVQGVFQHVDGVLGAVSGYAGGDASTASYHEVTTGATGHAEAVEITYDPDVITFGTILQVYFSVAHDPTQLDRQGPDIGPHYRSTIFPVDGEQAMVAQAYIHQLEAAGVFTSPIVTTIEPDRLFHAAEDYHQDYMVLHPTSPYIVHHDAPKLEALRTLFPERYRAEPVLVGVADTAD